ncbi:hypothetical protein [Lewinella sp. IMCC34183]|uniref:hypothetical protein n=1 Tax=Lewinella sp. IMCC34183 TaxID=2248762 RepID=UPI0013006065|nr:hypothetical protein [Lewinella sp. IMCC34183]
MKSLQQIKDYPSGKALYADSIIEFHASRLILLVRYCGVKERNSNTFRIDGLTKLAKLDFFVRYPAFFKVVCDKLKKQAEMQRIDIESKMIRFHYGPWDERYYQILPYLEARGIFYIENLGNQYTIRLSAFGAEIADQLFADNSFISIVHDLKQVKKVLGSMSGTKLKDLIYETFKDEVAIKKLRETIGYE